METKINFKSIYDRIDQQDTIMSEAGEELRRTIYEILDSVPDKRLEFDNDILDNMDGYVCVVYDGGNHPEYASRLDSVVESAYISDGKVYLETEDSDEYSLDRCYLNDLVGVARAVTFLAEARETEIYMDSQKTGK